MVTATKPGIKVLIIEDNPVNRFVLRSLLEECGHSVVEAENGANGVAAARGEAFDLIMTDISMPSMDGVEVARTIRQHEGPSQHARVVAVTAHALPADLARFQAAGIDDCMTKPITRVSLNAALNEPATLVNAAPDDLVLDYAQLADLTLRLGRSATAALIARVIAEGDAAEADDFWSAGPDGERRLHGLAGTAGTFGARQLQSGLAELLAARLSENAGDLARASTELSRLWHTTRTALHTEAGQLRAPYPIAAAGA